ncbi:tetratricopeptide repeat protein [Rhodospirillaceae bacterium]|nr:tetratricopeptide repeat protein [Rhodospirillaceae bacterium]
MDLTIDQALQHGVAAHKEGRLQDAERLYRDILKNQSNHPDANHNLGLLAVGVGKTAEALPYFKAALETNSKVEQFWLSYTDALIKLGQLDNARQALQKGRGSGLKGDKVDQLELQLNDTQKSILSVIKSSDPTEEEINKLYSLYNQGRLQEALVQGNVLGLQFPSNPFIPNILGAVYSRLGNYQEALGQLNKVVELWPDNAEGLNNLGGTLTELKRYEEAITILKKAIDFKPDYAEAHYNLGNALNELGQYEEAINGFNRAIQLNPGFVTAYNNLGVALNELGQYEAAISSYNKAIELDPNYTESYNNLGNILSSVEAREFSESLAKNYLDVLNFGTAVTPSRVIRSILVLLKHHDTIKKIISCKVQYTLEGSASEFCIHLLKIPLFLKIMKVCPIPDLEIEGILKQLRRILLLEGKTLSTNHNLLYFQNALALQCFTNEYIYGETEEETVAVKALEISLQKSFSNNEELSPYDIACLASYRSLFDYPWSTNVAPPAALTLLFKRQVAEVSEELALKRDISRLNPIKDDVSLSVKEQYEENPYPRWINTRLEIKPMSIKAVMANLELQVTNKITALSEAPQILIAGCGTGQHALTTATRFKNSHVTAIDLSLNSLAYAKRKTEELGVTNIDYLQADILDLRLLDKQFDVIESAGVLHHMAEPIAGWKVLNDCLKPGGLMGIGLYSELARQSVAKLRDVIAEKNICPDKEGILEVRQQIIKPDHPQFNLLQIFGDFYSTSELRDLLFHVQEHHFTLPQISEALDELGLLFLGFEFKDRKSNNLFKAAYPREEAINDLGKWHEYEILNPKIFTGMYQFWVQKL